MPTPEHDISPEDKRRAVDRILQSQTFARADQLRKFLRYVSEMEISGRASEISEYSIAVEALGRRQDYSPGDDSTVRGRAHDLRLKVRQFYETEGQNEAVRVKLQKGSYVPCFFFAAVETKPADSPAGPTAGYVQNVAGPRSRLRAIVISVFLLTVALAVVVWYTRPVRPKTIIQEFWGPLLQPDSDTLVCLGNPPTITLKAFHAPPLRGAFLPAPPELSAILSEWHSGRQLPQRAGPVFMIRSESPLFGDAAAAVTAARVLSRAGVRFQFLSEAGVRPAVLRERNLVFIGSPDYSTYAARILKKTPFTLYLNQEGEEAISDGPLESGPRRIFAAQRDDVSRSLTVGYGLITVFSTNAAAGSKTQTVLCSGIAGAGVQAAMEFFSSDAGLGQLRARFQKDGVAAVPPSYQVVVKCSIERSLLWSWELADYAAIERPPVLD